MGQVNETWIDVRERDEFRQERIPDSESFPLSELSVHLPALIQKAKDGSLTLVCRSGQRAALAAQQLKDAGIPVEKCRVLEQGLTGWKARGGKTLAVGKPRPSIFQQVQMVAGALLIGFALLSLLVSPWFVVGDLLVGMGLFFAGFTGQCWMAVALSKLPWNRGLTCTLNESASRNVG